MRCAPRPSSWPRHARPPVTQFTVLATRRRRGRGRGSPRRRGAEAIGARRLPRRPDRRVHAKGGLPAAVVPARVKRWTGTQVEFFWATSAPCRPTIPSRTSASPTGCSSRSCRTSYRTRSTACRPRRPTSTPLRSATRASCVSVSARAARSARVRPHLARDGAGRPRRQPLPRLGRARGDDALGCRQLGAGPGRVAHDAHLPGSNAARGVIFVVIGADKAAALRAVRSGGSDLPAARVDGEQVEWFVDCRRGGRAG